jgi:hypothetical protein
MNPQWRSRLRSPQGQLQLLGATLLGCVVLALVLSTQQRRFESLIREKPAETSAATLRLAKDLNAGENLPIDAVDLERLYDLWLISDDSQSPEVVRILTQTDPSWFRDRTQRTLIAGSTPQRLRALALIEQSRDKAMLPVLRRVLLRYETMGPHDAILPCQQTLRVISDGGDP